MRYEIVDHTADVMVHCSGETLEECFENAAYALFDQMVDISDVDPVMSVDVDVSGDDNESRLYAFLSELLFIQDSEMIMLSEFKVRFDGDRVKCVAYGEPLDATKHTVRGEIKAITYHMLSVDEDEPSLTVIFDV